MHVIETVRELQGVADRKRAAGRRLALVPTMGALHAGHLSLVAEARGRGRADHVCVSIFVNPTQFGPQEDLTRYPRDLERDLELCREHGVDAVFTPDVAEMYPPGAQSWVEVGELGRPLCGRSRPGHFRGVATVVTKLFVAARPHVAVFGEKDYQQLALIRRLARDLRFDIEILGAPIVREPDGLALSSRNRGLGPRARVEAAALSRALDAAQKRVEQGELGIDRLLLAARAEIGRASQAEIDYVELRDPDTLEPAPARLAGPALLALAVHMRPDPDGQGSRVRLIDNRVLRPALEDSP
jgi:pantoate--beta-alanine ligase